MDATTALEAIGLVSAAVAGIGFLYKKVVRPVAKTLVILEDSVPVLADIAHEFKNNSGSSLKDHLDKANANVLKAQHDSAQTRQALGLYIKATDARFTQLEEAVNGLVQTVTALSVPAPRKPRTARPRASQTSPTQEGASGARS